MDIIKEFDTVLLHDGCKGCVTDVLGNQDMFYIDIGDSPESYANITVTRQDIVKVLHTND